MKEIYQSSVKEVLGQMGSREEGLTIKEVEKSREKCGWNELAEGKKKSVLQIFLEQYKDFLVYGDTDSGKRTGSWRCDPSGSRGLCSGRRTTDRERKSEDR